MSTPAIADIVASPRAVKALAAKGYKNISDLEGVAIESLATIPGVGQVTLDAILKAAAPSTDPVPVGDDAWEEGPHPIHLDSPYGSLSLRLTEAGEIRDGKRVRIIKPHFIRFNAGSAQLTREQYFTMKYGDKERVRSAVLDNEPWRLDAIQWLKAKPGFKSRWFVILTD